MAHIAFIYFVFFGVGFAICGVGGLIVDRLKLRRLQCLPPHEYIQRIAQPLAKKAEIDEPFCTTQIIEKDNAGCIVSRSNFGRSVIVVGDQLVDILSEIELECVIGHEIIHIRNKDAGSQDVFFAHMLGLLAAFKDFVFRRPEDHGIILFLMWFSFALLLPVAIFAARSRRKEHRADRDAIAVLGCDAGAMVTALEKLEALHSQKSRFEFPFLSSHPSFAKRSAEIKSLKRRMAGSL